MRKKDYEQLKLALSIARDAHKNDKDKANDDYIFHPVLVALECKTTKEKIVALLHDVVEDHGDKYSIKELTKLGFSSDVIEALKLVTHIKEESISDVHEEYRNYIERLRQSGNSIAINVKIADLTNNLDTSRLNGNKPPKYDDYRWALSYLTIIE